MDIIGMTKAAEALTELGDDENDVPEVKEVEAASTCHGCVIHPLSIFHSVWDFSVSIVLMLTIVTMPISMAFEGINDDMFYFNLLVDLIFISDLIKSFFTGCERPSPTSAPVRPRLSTFA